MCTGKCAKIIGKALFPLGTCAIVANLLLYFPNGQILEVEQITDFVWFFHGIVGAGLLAFLPAFMMLGAGGDGCCANRCGMLLTVILSALGTIGGAYCVVISAMGLVRGPLCDTGDGEYIYPFRNDTEEENYLFHHETWSTCKAPENVVLWNVVLFSILLAIGAIEAVLCLIQVINGAIGVICGTCLKKRRVSATAA
ncbi:transmembrane 4 L6 family member 1-like [Hyla sarda]|uniref:transmembrane 4 L6 family member 1-like n=1 Tax=Hyla sarda TaxID=327740 RepID=UPI0024C309BF|nr:transmembrane 4 L6 family member 1-like [Hyla sarda]XP_056417458.1 transmembrane 4 L6 family member 1-like [Hyla sarda]XP_056417459.1 transmembrane 4 L6 family member 1-like [Hyla sarda]XP_056417460.1 transmembrane 4 L6 family member 1-like [Hyla sarda]